MKRFASIEKLLMKKILTCFCVLTLTVIANAQDNSFRLQGKINGLDRGKIYLNYRNLQQVNVLDSVVVINGLFSFSGKISEPTRAYLYSSAKKQVDPENANEIMFFIEPSEMMMQLEQGKFFQLKLAGSKTQDEWIGYQKRESSYENKWQPILSTIKKAETEKNWPLYDSLTDKFMNRYADGKKQLYIDFVRTNPNSYISLDLLSFNRHKLEFDSLYLFYQNLHANIRQARSGIELGQFILKEDSLQIGKQAPIISFTDKDSVSRTLSDFKGKFVLLDFWASWCGPCIQEMPALDKLAQKYQMLGVQVWGVNVENDSSAAKAYLSKVQVAFPILFDVDNSVSKDYRVEAMPTTVILDKDGKVRSVHRGYKPGYEKKYEDDIKGLLRE